MKKEPLFVKSIKYGENNPGFLWADMVRDLELTETEEEILYRSFGSEDPVFMGGRQENVKNYTTMSSSFHLIEYEELKLARKDSRRAMIMATLALSVSIILAAASIVISIYYVSDVSIVTSIPLNATLV